jgi:hypothetical protein
MVKGRGHKLYYVYVVVSAFPSVLTFMATAIPLTIQAFPEFSPKSGSSGNFLDLTLYSFVKLLPRVV